MYSQSVEDAIEACAIVSTDDNKSVVLLTAVVCYRGNQWVDFVFY